MKILMVTRETRSDQRYGLGRSLAPIVEEFRRRGVDVDYLCQADLGPRAISWQHRFQRLLSSLPGPKNTHTHFPTLFQVLLERFNMGRLAAKLAALKKYTHVHCHDPYIAIGLRFFLRFYPGYKAIWGVTEHGFGCYTQAIHEDGVQLGQHVMRIMRRWEANTLLAASWVIAPTRRGILQIAHDLSIHPLPAHWHHLVHARPVVNCYRRKDARNRLGWNETAIYILSIGRIAPVKQYPLLIEACARLKLEKEFQLVILGEGDHSTLQKLAQQSGFAHEILFAVAEDIGLYLCAADLYVSASASESFGLANLEALVTGTAAVCTTVGGVPEVVKDGALLSEPNIDALAEAMQRMLSDQKLRETIAQQGLARANSWPDVIKITDRYEAIYRQATTN
ncbi:hypothetical protein C7H79_09105 [Nitrosomonas supralitoralis]|uniref:Glycosyl transferase family 1 domain-containing protein n=2 Tax=Nitrosomonas supralitoralis TaxID=2116706 RepID=A0A2P7NUU1_9PROT|nr:hypothetical protein C7H79_09105 [Nitrosomonas supralitoralis]